MTRCKSCGDQVPTGLSHRCRVEGRTIAPDESDFLLSLAVGAATDNALLGAVVGGSMTGAIVGDMIADGDVDFGSDDGSDGGDD